MKSALALLLAFQISLGYSQPNLSDQIQEDMEAASAALLILLENEQVVRNLEDLPIDVQFRYMPGSGVAFSMPLGPQISVPQVLGVKERSFIGVSNQDEHPENVDRKANDYVEAGKAAIWSFFTNYGSLLRNLGPAEGVVMKVFWMKHHPQLIKKDDPNRIVAGIEMSVEVSDLLDYDAGNIDEAALLDKVKIKELPEENRSADAEVFGGILRKLMSENLSETYFISRSPRSHAMSSIGLMYDIQLYSSYESDDGYSIPSLARKNLSKSERDALVEDLYPKFIEDFQKIVIKYGHVLKTVPDDESVMFRIRLTKCVNCSMPSEIELSVGKSTLSRYRAGEITVEQGLAAFELRTIR